MSTLTITLETDRAITLALLQANQHRRERTLRRSQIDGLIERVRESREHAWIDGGTVAAAYGYRAWTTVALAVSLDGVIYLGIGESPAASSSPGRIWNILAPWNRGKPETIERKLREWTTGQGVIKIS